MNIAILLPGHIRAWDMCKVNFISNIYQTTGNNIDVFVDTYYQIFRTDAENRNEKSISVTKTEDEIKAMFEGINVVYWNIENEDTSSYTALAKLKKMSAGFQNYCQTNNKTYDLVVRSRCDIMVDYPLDYPGILAQLQIDPNTVYCGTGILSSGPNDMLNISSAYNIDLILNRLELNLSSVFLNYLEHLKIHVVRYNSEMQLVPEQYF